MRLPSGTKNRLVEKMMTAAGRLMKPREKEARLCAETGYGETDGARDSDQEAKGRRGADGVHGKLQRTQHGHRDAAAADAQRGCGSMERNDSAGSAAAKRRYGRAFRRRVGCGGFAADHGCRHIDRYASNRSCR